jgi:hypothetical protein
MNKMSFEIDGKEDKFTIETMQEIRGFAVDRKSE